MLAYFFILRCELNTKHKSCSHTKLFLLYEKLYFFKCKYIQKKFYVEKVIKIYYLRLIYCILQMEVQEEKSEAGKHNSRFSEK